MQKRGASRILWNAFELLAVGFIIVLMMTLAKNWSTGESIKQLFLVKDSALMIDALHAVPGDVIFNYQTINYTNDLKMSTLLDNSIQMIGPIGPLYLIPYRPGLPKVIGDEFLVEKSKVNTIQFIRIGSDILFGKDLQYSEKIRCLNINTKDLDWKNKEIAVDPEYVDDLEISENNRQLALSLFGLLKSANVNVKETRSIKENEARTLAERIEETKDAKMIISITTISQENKQLNIYISNSEKSSKLACLIANNLVKYGFNSISILPSDNQILKEDVPSVLIEIRSKDLKNNLVKYGDGIYKAIKEYYE